MSEVPLYNLQHLRKMQGCQDTGRRDAPGFVAKVQVPAPETRNPKPETRNPKPETRNLKSETRNPKPETRNPKAGLAFRAAPHRDRRPPHRVSGTLKTCRFHHSRPVSKI